MELVVKSLGGVKSLAKQCILPKPRMVQCSYITGSLKRHLPITEGGLHLLIQVFLKT